MQRLNPLPQFLLDQNCRLFDIDGHVYRVRTDVGSIVHGWVAADRYEQRPNPDRNRHYFCHGHSLGTYREFGYSVFSGPDLATVLRDEYLLVGSLTNAQSGDLLVWHNVYPDKRHPDHSAILTFLGAVPQPSSMAVHRAAATDIRRKLEESSQVSTKNGGYGPVLTQTVQQVCGIYGNVYAIYRRKFPK